MKTKRAVPRTRKRTAAPASTKAKARPARNAKATLEEDPLTAPLRQLAAAVPALLEALAAGRGSGTAATPQEPTTPAFGLEDAAPYLALARDAVAAARARVDRALSALPRAGEYEPVARQLRELATVSPSLMEWLREIPALTAPLTASIDELREALAELDVALAVLGAQRTTAPDTGAERVKVVVRG